MMELFLALICTPLIAERSKRPELSVESGWLELGSSAIAAIAPLQKPFVMPWGTMVDRRTRQRLLTG